MQILVKICRNLIFFKISAKKKNLVSDLVHLMDEMQDEEGILIDVLRILSKISEKETISIKICRYPKIDCVVKSIFVKY